MMNFLKNPFQKPITSPPQPSKAMNDDKITSQAVVSHPGIATKLSIIVGDKVEVQCELNEDAILSLLDQCVNALQIIRRDKKGGGI